jgi:phage major head subunit gpT-like protein
MPNLTTVFNAMSDFRDDKGDRVFTMPNVLLTGISYREQATKICGPKASKLEPFTAENDANIYSDLVYIYNPLITGKKWFLLDGDRMKNFLNWFDARKAVIESDGDFDTEVMKFKVVSMFSYGFDHWDWIAGSNAD